jgi:hypothetical protein
VSAGWDRAPAAEALAAGDQAPAARVLADSDQAPAAEAPVSAGSDQAPAAEAPVSAGSDQARVAPVSAGWDQAPVEMGSPEAKTGLAPTRTPTGSTPELETPPTKSLGFAPPPTHFPTRRQE